jgi:transcriptional regulator with XRE-family HTH domain
MNALDPVGGRGRPHPRIWYEPVVLQAVLARDFTRVHQLLQKRGFSQQRIAALTGQSQPEVSAVIHGRKIMAYDVISRVVDGLGIPRGLAGVCFCWCKTSHHLLSNDLGAPHRDPPDHTPAAGSAEAS